MGNLGWDTHRNEIEGRCRDVLRLVGAPEPVNFMAAYAFGSTCGVIYKDLKVGQIFSKRWRKFLNNMKNQLQKRLKSAPLTQTYFSSKLKRLPKKWSRSWTEALT